MYPILYRVGFASQPNAEHRGDGLKMIDCYITAAVRCAPPDNKPTPVERDTCAPWLHRELTLLRGSARVVVALGAFAWAAYWPALRAVYGLRPPPPRPAFGHGARVDLPGAPTLLGCYHVSQQNTFTGRLTPAMLDDVLATAVAIASGDRPVT